MKPKKIFALYGGDEQEGAALDFAAGLAKRYQAHLECWDIIPDPKDIYVPSIAMGKSLTYPPEMIAEAEKEAKKNAALARAKITSASEKKRYEDISFHSLLGSAENIIPARGRLADLIVIGRVQRNISYPSAVNAALFGCGHPVVIVPPGKEDREFNGNILIAWNGGREAARAVSSALPYMTNGKVWIFAGNEKETGHNLSLSAKNLAAYLGQHGINAGILPEEQKTFSPDSILNAARACDAGMIVMGAWGHARLYEYILGGVTEFMLENADIPVFMEH